MEKLEVLKATTAGKRVAEEEIEGLKNYFIKTFLWEQLLSDEIDIVFGCKGSGKSALYNHLSTMDYALLDKNVLLCLAENPRGTTAFKDLSITPPVGEFEFKSIWKLYFVLIVTQKLQEYSYDDRYLKDVVDKLQESDLIPRQSNFASILKMVRDYISRINPKFEPTVGINERTGMVDSLSVKISLVEPSVKQADKGIVSVDRLLQSLNDSLHENKQVVWIAIDRLDAVFQDDFELEARALRTLFQVYTEIQGYANIRLMIFLRDDIWNKIIENGFRESSHITRTATINWDQNALFSLLMTRLENNKCLIDYFNLNLPADKPQRDKFFASVFPKQTLNKANFTFSYIISRLIDGSGNVSPRELIHLVNASISNEIKSMLDGTSQNDSLLSIDSFYSGLKETSKTKLDTLVAEYPQMKSFIFRLKNKNLRVRFDLDELKDIWDLSKKDVKVIASNLLKIGFFKNEENEENPKYFIPVIFRPALGLGLN